MREGERKRKSRRVRGNRKNIGNEQFALEHCEFANKNQPATNANTKSALIDQTSLRIFIKTTDRNAHSVLDDEM